MKKVHQVIYNVLAYTLIAGLGTLAVAKDRQEMTLYEHFNIFMAAVLILSGLIALIGLLSCRKEVEFAGIAMAIVSILGYEIISLAEFGTNHIIFMAILYRPLTVLFLLGRGYEVRKGIKPKRGR